MTETQLNRRQKRSEGETFIIAETAEGFRVSSANVPSKCYMVTGTPDTPQCTCPDFQRHQDDPAWRCKHILAVMRRGNGDGGQGFQDDGANGYDGERPVQMLLRRSVSPDGRIDSLSIEFACPVKRAASDDVTDLALALLRLQEEIAAAFLESKPRRGDQSAPPPPGHGQNGAVPAQLLGVGGMDGPWGRRLFIEVDAGGRRLRLFGSVRQLAAAITAAGFPQLGRNVVEGLALNLPCLVTTKPSTDGRYLNVDRVLPANGRSQAAGRARS